MPEREQVTEEHLAAIRKTSRKLAERLEGHSPQTIALTHELLQQTETAGHRADNLASLLHTGLQNELFDKENLPQILRVLYQTARAGHDPRPLAMTLRTGLATKAFAENLPQVLPMLHQTAVAGRDPDYFA